MFNNGNRLRSAVGWLSIHSNGTPLKENKIDFVGRLQSIGHFRVVLYLLLKRVLVHSLSYENEFSFTSKKLNSFSYERLCNKPRFQKEAQDNKEMAYLKRMGLHRKLF